MTETPALPRPLGVAAAEQLSPAFPERAVRGTADKLRAWQQEALERYWQLDPQDFLAAATPGAGKTTFALRLAVELRARGLISQVIVVAPTEHLKRQWADAASRVSLRLNPLFRNAERDYGRHFHGVAVTYAQVAARSAVHRRLVEARSTLVILDEVHHGGDALSWGDAIRDAFSGAARRLLLTGTPFRSDDAPIPFVEYHPEGDGTLLSRSDYRYGYGRALRDGVVRPVLFHSYEGRMRWRTKAGEHMEARLGDPDTPDITAQAWRTALDPEGEWIPSVLDAANRRLDEIRRDVPDAGGLVIATDHAAAKGYAARLEQLTGRRPVVVLSDDTRASARIEQFANGTERWMVAVRMVSEGVDVPRLCVGVYATSAATPLYFAQAIGRFVRARRRGETASIFLPTVPALHELAGAMEQERDHALGRAEAEDQLLQDDLMAEAQREDAASGELAEGFEFAALESNAQFSRMLYQGQEFGSSAEVGSLEEQDFLGFPGLLEPEQVRALLQHRQARQQRRIGARIRRQDAGGAAVAADAGDEADAPLYRSLAEQRRLLNSLVGMRAKGTGQPHGHVHAELRRQCGGPPVSKASMAQLQSRIELLRRWMGLR